MQDDAIVRDFEPADTQACVQIALAAWAPIFASFRETMGDELFSALYPDWQKTKEDGVRRGCAGEHGAMVCIAEKDGRAVGFITFHCNHETRVGEIGNNAVHPDFQNKGIGTRMYQHVFDRMRALGMESVTVSTGGDPSHAPARRAYEKAGFTIQLPGVEYYRAL